MFKIVLTKNQWARISEIFGNLGLISIASIVIPYIFDKLNPSNIVLGLVIAVILWYISLIAARKY